MPGPAPHRRGEGVAPRPVDGRAVDGGRPAALHDAEDGVGRRPPGPGAGARLEAVDGEPHRRHVGRVQSDPRALDPFRVGGRGVEPAPDRVAGEAQRRVLGDRLDALETVGVVLDEHRFEQMDQRHVEPVEPVGRPVAVMAVAVPLPARGQHDVPGVHRRLDAVDRRIGAFGVDDDPERVRGVAVRARGLARQDHLVGRDQRAGGGDAGGIDRVAHHEVAAFGEFGVDQPPRRVERRPAFVVAPMRRREAGGGFAAQDRLRAVDPPGGHLHGVERGIKSFERIRFGDLRDVRHGRSSPSSAARRLETRSGFEPL